MNDNNSIWTMYPEALSRAEQLREDGNSWAQVAKQLSEEFGAFFSYDAVVSKVKKHWGLKKPVTNSNYTTKLIISDTHFPFHSPKLNEIIEQYKGIADELYIGGDMLDMYACSTFVKRKDIALRYEMAVAHQHLTLWSKWFKKIIIISGNHEERLGSFFQKRVDPAILFLIETDILQHFEKGFSFENEIGEEIYFAPIKNLETTEDWFIEIGDAILAHPKNFSRVDGKTGVATNEYFIKHGYQHNAVLIGHTHQAAKVMNSGKLIMEIGCCCEEQEYATRGNINYRPQTNAITLLVQKDGITDLNQTNFIVY